jgi:uracil permease
MTTNQKQTVGILPDESPKFSKTILFALQQVLCAMPATILVPLICGMSVSVTLFGAGLATMVFIICTKRQISLFYGSSFSYITAIVAITGVTKLGQAADPHLISIAQTGIIASGVISIVAGLLIGKFGKKVISKILPCTVTGSIALVIGLSLAGVAITGAAENWGIAIIVLLATILFSVFLKGTLSQLPILLGIILGYLICIPAGLIDFTKITSASLITIPHFTLPTWSWMSILAIAPIAFSTIPESSAHLFQLDLYVNDLAKKKGKKEYDIAGKLDKNLIFDGVGDMICGFIGASPGTNYGENLGLMSITKNFSSVVLIVAAIITMIVSFSGTLSAVIFSIPNVVISAISIFLFGTIACQGVAIMVNEKVDMFNTKNLAVISTILIIGIGGTFSFGGMIPFFGVKLPAIATASIFGIILNLILNIGEK